MTPTEIDRLSTTPVPAAQSSQQRCEPRHSTLTGALDQAATASISVIMPTLNEEAYIGPAMERLQRADVHEIIVADGHSDDGTVRTAESLGARVVVCDRCRGRQLNAGAAAATGEILLFLHADTALPAQFETVVREILQTPEVSAGAFNLRIDGPRRSYRMIERAVSWRSRILGMPYGDQAVFTMAETFHRAGEFPDFPTMEDFELARRLRRLGRIQIASLQVITSARRWSKRGIWRTTILNSVCIAGYLLGVSPGRIAAWRSR